jgi:tetratricopeptide (TPR) repeat protein
MPEEVDARLRLDALERVAILAWQVHQFDAAMHFAEQATALARSNGRPEQLAFSLNLMGRIFIEQGDYSRAEATLQESLQFARQIPHLYSPGCPLAHLGELALARGDWEAGQTQLAQAVTFLTDAATTMTVEEEKFRIDIHVAIAHTDLAEIALAQGNVAQASHALRQVLPYARLYMRRLHCMLVTLAGLLLTRLHTTQAAEAQAAAGFLGAAAGLSERTGDVLSPFHQTLITQRAAYAQQLLSQRQWQAAWRVGYTWTQAQAVTEAEKWLPMNS